MIDFRRTPCSTLWTKHSHQFDSDGLCGGGSYLPSVCDPILNALNRLSVSPESSKWRNCSSGECQHEDIIVHPGRLVNTNTEFTKHSLTLLCITAGSTSRDPGQDSRPCIDDLVLNMSTGSERSHIPVEYVNSYVTNSVQLPSDTYKRKYALYTHCSTVAPSSKEDKSFKVSPVFDILGCPTSRDECPISSACMVKDLQWESVKSQARPWNNLSLRDAVGAALSILISKPKPGSRRQPTRQSHRTKEWDHDTLRLHSWFNAICLLEIPASLKQMFLTVRRKLEEDYVLCVFCRNNGESPEVYVTHEVKDQNGRVTCPVLRILSCPNCHATGDHAHTIRYCPHPRQFN
ncbi:unnamed protein product [Heterobilharzia americana]|nr:unnamed protein product [Heterobilharzia americana]